MSLENKKIVCLGGGNAMPKVVLKELKACPVKISAVCATLDNGGSSGRLREEYDIVSPGDIRRSFIALSEVSPALEKILNYRFESGSLKGHNFTNLLIAALDLNTDSYEEVIEEMSRILKIKHKVLPATLDKADICAILENEQVIKGETNIDVIKHDGNLKIKEVFLDPKAKAYSGALEALVEADVIIIGPGDLYSSLSQVLLPEGISEAIQESGAKKIYICNLMTKFGETNDFSVLDFTKEIEKYLGGELDFVLYNNSIPDEERIESYKGKHPELMELVKINDDLPQKFIGNDLLLNEGKIEHDPKKVIKSLTSLI